MKKFKFTLQPVLTLRQRQEQHCLEVYARALLERTRALEKVRAADTLAAAAQTEWRSLLENGGKAADIAREALNCRLIEQQREELIAQASEAERKVNLRMQEMVAARQAREAVEKSLERKRQQHAREQFRQEQSFFDELAQRDRTAASAWGV